MSSVRKQLWSQERLRLADLLGGEGAGGLLAPLLGAPDVWAYLLDLDAGGRLLDANEGGLLAIGCSKLELSELDVSDVLEPERGAGLCERLLASTPGTQVQVPCSHLHRDGHRTRAMARAWTLGGGGHSLGFVFIANCRAHAQELGERRRLLTLARRSRELDLQLRHELDLDRLLGRVCEIIVAEQGFESAWVRLNAATSGQPRAASHGAGLSEPELSRWLQENEPTRCWPAVAGAEDPLVMEFAGGSACPGCACAGVHADCRVLVVRVTHDGELLGVLNAARRRQRPHPVEDRDLLAQIADTLGHALQAIRSRRLEQDAKDVMEVVADTMQVALFTLVSGPSDLPWSLEVLGEGAREVLGFQPEEALRDPLALWERVHEDDRSEFTAALQGALERGASLAEFRFEHPQRGPRRLQGHFRVSERGPAALVGSLLDVTPLRSAENEVTLLQARLARAEKLQALGQLAGGIAHDFNNLLTTITSYSRFLERSLEPSDSRRADTRRISGAAERAAVLTRKLLAFGRQAPREPVPVDLRRVVEGTVGLLERTISANVRLELDLPLEAVTVLADAGDVDQVLLNLALNARDAMPSGGRLRIELREIDCDARISVCDEGIGMDETTAARVFDPFFTTRGEKGGTGLGLATSYGIIDSLGGRLEVETALGEGTTFRVFLPSFLGAGPLPSNSLDAMLPVAMGRILVVEDDPSVRDAAVRALEEAGFDVVEAPDVPEALDVLAASAEDLCLVLSDVVLPSGRGFQVEVAAGQHRPDLPVLLMSGYAQELVFGVGREPGQRPVLQKPFTPEQLVRAVLSALPASNPWSIAPAAVPVLLVEDDVLVREAIEQVLSESDQAVVAVESISEARELLNGNQDFAAVISDQHLPDGLGLRLFDWLVTVRPSLAGRLLLTTGGTGRDHGAPTAGGKPVDVLLKPFDAEELVAWLDRVTA